MDESTEAALMKAGFHMEHLNKLVFELRAELAAVKAKAITEERVAEAVRAEFEASTHFVPDAIDFYVSSILVRLRAAK